MGAVCAIVYLLAIISFIPFAFYKDIVAATSGGGNRDVVVEVQHVETGRMLHRFPHGKVCYGPIISTRLLYWASADDHSWRPICPVSSPYSALPSSALEMTFLTFDGDTKSLFLHSERFQC